MSNTKTPLKDGCPIWAEDLIAKLREVEILLGHIPESLAWKSQHLSDVAKRAFAKEDAVFDEQKVEFLYKRIARGLTQETFTAQQIAAFINARIGFEGAPPYTSASEVEEALEG